MGTACDALASYLWTCSVRWSLAEDCRNGNWLRCVSLCGWGQDFTFHNLSVPSEFHIWSFAAL